MFIYLDMDGVLANFEEWAYHTIGADWKEEIKKDKWGKLSSYPNLYAELPPMKYAKELYVICCSMLKDTNRVQILTAVPSKVNFENCAKHKIEWAKKHVHPDIKVNFGPYAKDKQYHCKHETDILIDDSYLKYRSMEWYWDSTYVI